MRRRLKVFQVLMPPLRDRDEDLEDLVPYFIEEVNRDEGTEVDGVDSECLAALRTYSWPGNVRELRNVLHQTIVTRGRSRIRLGDLPEEILSIRHHEDRFEVRIGASMDEVQRELVWRTLESSAGNRTRAAEILKIPRRSLYDLLQRNGIPPRFKS
jgi:transcriptional regulator with PAS, ATPase and Fis domain